MSQPPFQPGQYPQPGQPYSPATNAPPGDYPTQIPYASPYGYQMPIVSNPDVEHLNVLKILTYVCSGLCLFGILFGGFYIVLGAVSSSMSAGSGTPPPQVAFIREIFLGIGIGILALSATMGALLFFSARGMATRTNRMLSLITAGIICINFPLGTALGVFTFIVLSRPSVKAMYDQAQGGYRQ